MANNNSDWKETMTLPKRVSTLARRVGRPVAVLATAGVMTLAISATANAAIGVDMPGTVIEFGGTGDPQSNYLDGLVGGAAGHPEIRVHYPASLAPFYPGVVYDDSVAAGVASGVNKVLNTPGHKTLFGFSQGARVAGDVAEHVANDPSIPDSSVSAVLAGDPRAPRTGIELWAPNIIPGTTMRGPRGSMGNVKVTQVCMRYDAICDSSGLSHGLVGWVNMGFGYYLQHAGNGKYTYANASDSNTTTWTEGNTTYKVIDAPAPINQLFDNAGIPLPEPARQAVEDASRDTAGPFRSDPPVSNPVDDAINNVSNAVDDVVQSVSQAVTPPPSPAPAPPPPPPPPAPAPVPPPVQDVVNTVNQAVNDVNNQVQAAIDNSPLAGIIP